MITDRCTGHCCRKFPLPISPEDIEEERTKVASGGPSRWKDGETLVDMLVYLGQEGERLTYADGRPRYFYTCRHYDAATGNCLNYEGRPEMCSEYPYGKPCEHGTDCTWETGRLGLHPKRLHAEEQVKRCAPDDPRLAVFRRAARGPGLVDWSEPSPPEEEPR